MFVIFNNSLPIGMVFTKNKRIFEVNWITIHKIGCFIVFTPDTGVTINLIDVKA